MENPLLNSRSNGPENRKCMLTAVVNQLAWGLGMPPCDFIQVQDNKAEVATGLVATGAATS